MRTLEVLSAAALASVMSISSAFSQTAPLVTGLPPAAVEAPAPAVMDAQAVLVLPFAAANTGDREWISRGIQQDLAVDLSRGTRLRVLTPSAMAPVRDERAALEAARELKVGYVIFGQFQSTETEVRITGQVLDVSTGLSVGGLKTTGPARDLFHMEDALSQQVMSNLPVALLVRHESRSEVQPAAGDDPVLQAAPRPAPATTDVDQDYRQYNPPAAADDTAGAYQPYYAPDYSAYQPPVQYSTPQYSYPSYDAYPYYTYPYYYSGYPYGYIYFNGGFFGRGRHRDRDRDDRGWHSRSGSREFSDVGRRYNSSGAQSAGGRSASVGSGSGMSSPGHSAGARSGSFGGGYRGASHVSGGSAGQAGGGGGRSGGGGGHGGGGHR